MWASHCRLPASSMKISQQFWNAIPLACIKWLWADSYPRNVCLSHLWKGSLGWILEKEKNPLSYRHLQPVRWILCRKTNKSQSRQNLSQMYWIFFTLIHWEIVLQSTQHKVSEYSTAAFQECTPKYRTGCRNDETRKRSFSFRQNKTFSLSVYSFRSAFFLTFLSFRRHIQ